MEVIDFFKLFSNFSNTKMPTLSITGKLDSTSESNKQAMGLWHSCCLYERHDCSKYNVT